MKAFVIGGATLDTIIRYEEMERLTHKGRNFERNYLLLEEGSKIEVAEQQYFSGGGATNAAVSFKRLGIDVELLCKIAKDAAGEVILKELKNYGVDTSQICYSDKEGTAASFVVPSLSGDRTVFAYRGANTTLLSEELPQALGHCDFAYITSLSKASSQRLPEIVKFAKEHDVAVAINPGVSQLKIGSGFLKDSLWGVDILITNLQEAEQLMSSLLRSDDQLRHRIEEDHSPHVGRLDERMRFEDSYFSLRQYFKEALKLGPKVVVVTAGSEGVYVATQENLYFHPAKKVNLVNTLGAGDAFGSSFVASYFLGDSIENAIRAGIVNSASVIMHPDAKTGLMDRAAILKEISTLSPHLLEVRQ
ncbi:MAG: carbohydrate kinase family protein [Gammaproteobacteria bacterium]|nr:carbohydrate kinase family protein [Gammaproteobacteria bacterium]